MYERGSFLRVAAVGAALISTPMGVDVARAQSIPTIPEGSVWSRNLAVQTSAGCVDAAVSAGWTIREGEERKRGAVVTGLNRGGRFTDWVSVHRTPSGPRILREVENYVETNLPRIDEITPSYCPPPRTS